MRKSFAATTRSEATSKFLSAIMLLSLTFSGLESNLMQVVQAQNDIYIDFRTYVQDTGLQRAVFDAMHARPSNSLVGNQFAVTSENNKA